MSLVVVRDQTRDCDVVTVSGVIRDEPLFPIRARDLLALPTIDQYLTLCERLRLTKQHGVRRAIEEFEAWQRTNPHNMVGNDHRHVYVRDQVPTC